MRLEEVHKDWRGTVSILKSDEKELATIFTTCNGALRGGHSHPYDTQIVVLEGAIDFMWTDDSSKPNESKWKRYDAVTNPIVIIPKDVPLLVISVGDSVTAELKGLHKYKIDNYPPYRKLIDMKKPMNVDEVLKQLSSE